MALAGALEHAAGMIARLDMALASHPLRPAWAWRARLDAIGRQAAVDGKAIDPWHLAALIEGVRLRLDHTPVLIDRGMLFAAAHHAFELYRWFAVPDETQRAAIRLAADHLETVGNAHSPLLGAALGVHAWLDQGGARPPLRAALALYWQQRQVTALPCPLLTGAAALGTDIPWARDDWIGHFLAALAGEAEDGLALLALLERHWFAARGAVAGRRRDSHAAAAIDILAAAPLVSATTLGQALGIATNNAARLLDGFVGLGIVSEVSQRAKRRLMGSNTWRRCAKRPHHPAVRCPGAAPAGRVPPRWLPMPAARLPISGFPWPPPLPCSRSNGRNSTLATSTIGSISPIRRSAVRNACLMRRGSLD